MLAKRKGLTLLEIIIAIMIAAIAVTLAVPSFISLYQTHHLKTTVHNLYYTLQFARSEAIKRNATVYFNFGSGDNWCYGANVTSNCNCSTANSCTLNQTTTTKTQDLSLSTTGTSSNSIQFDGTRGATSSTSTVTFTLYGQSIAMTISIKPLGNMTICSSQISGYPTCS